jgi:phosphoribosylaminoimidazolecarboxamide formyltransferase/IMP cyclohydrolase
VAVVVDPADYRRVVSDIRAHGAVQDGLRFELARKVFAHTAQYDGAIANWLGSVRQDGAPDPYPPTLTLQFHKIQSMRYGENPHQSAAFYRDAQPAAGSLSHFAQLQGKALSYNNIADADAAWECVKTFDQPACVIIKHANPCGVALGQDLAEAYAKALATDSTSAFGGIIAFNRPLDGVTAERVAQQFVEVLIAPGFDAAARTLFASKPNVRLLEIPLAQHTNHFDLKRVGGGLLIQAPDERNLDLHGLRVVTQVQPTEAQRADLLFAWRVAKFVKSNAIVFCAQGRTVGIGAGQMSRIDSARIASIKAQHAHLKLAGSVVASDAFFPFRDGLDVVADAGAVAVIQPGGSVRDNEVIAAANERGITMVFTDVRHFRH